MQLNSTQAPRIKTLIESHSTKYQHTHTNHWNPKRLIGLFQIALNYREFIHCPLTFFYKLQFVQATTETKLKIYSLAAKLFFQEECDDALNHLFLELPFPLIAKHLRHLRLFFKNSDRTVTIDELKESITLFDKIQSFQRLVLAAALSEFHTSRRLEFLRELIKPGNAAHLDMMASLAKEKVCSEYRNCFNLFSIPKIFEILTQVKILYADHRPENVINTICTFCRLTPNQRHLILKLSPHFADFPYGIDKFISTYKNIPFEIARSEIAAVRPLIHAKTSQNEMSRLFNVIARIPPHKRESAVQLVNECKITFNKPELLGRLWDLTKYEAHNLLKWAKCFELGKDGRIWDHFVVNLGSIPDEERSTLISLYQQYSQACHPKKELWETTATSDSKPSIFSINAFSDVCKMNPVHRENILKAHHLIFSITGYNAFIKGNFNLTKSYYRLSQSEPDAERLFNRLYSITQEIDELEPLLISLHYLTPERRLEAVKVMETTECYILVLKHSLNDIKEFCEVSRLLFPEKPVDASNYDVISKIPGSRIQFVNTLKPIITGASTSDVLSILEIAINYTHEELAQIVSYPCPPATEDDSRVNLFKLLIDCYHTHTIDLYLHCLTLKTKEMKNREWYALLTILLDCIPEERKEFLELSKVLLQNPEDRLADILIGLSKLTLGGLKEKLRQIEVLQKHHFAKYSIGHLFVQLSSVDIEELDQCIQNVNLIIERFPQLEKRDQLFPQFASYSPVKLRSVCDTIPLFQKNVTSYAYFIRLTVVANPARRDEISTRLECLKPLFVGLSEIDQLTIYQLFSSVPIDDIPDAIKDLQHLTKQKKDQLIAYSRNYVEWNNTKSHRTAVLNYYEVLSQDMHDSSPEILGQMKYFSEPNWTRLYPVCLPFFQHFPCKMSLKVELINLLSSGPTQVAEEMVGYALTLNLKENVIYILRCIAKFPKHARPQLINDLLLCMPRMDTVAIDTALASLEKIPPSESKVLIPEALQHFKYAMDSDFFNAIYILKLIPATIRRQLLEFMKIFTPEMACAKKQAIMSALSKNLPPERWEEGLAIINRLPSTMHTQLALPLLLNENIENRNYLLLTIAQYGHHVNDSEHIRFLEELCSVQPEKRPPLLDYVARVLNNQLEKDYLKLTYAIRCLKEVPFTFIDEMISSEDWKKHLSHTSENYLYLANLYKYSTEERRLIFDHVLPLLEGLDPNFKPLHWFLEHLWKVEAKDRRDFVQFVMKITQGCTIYLSFEFLKTLFKAKQAQSPLWVVVPSILSDSHMTTYPIPCLMELERAKQEHLISSYRLVCEYRHLNLTNLSKLIATLTRIPENKRRGVFANALNLAFMFGRNLDELIGIMITLSPLSEEDTFSLNQTMDFIRKKIDCRSSLSESHLRLCLQIPAKERLEVIAVLFEVPWTIRGSLERLLLTPVILKIVQDKDVNYLREVYPIIKKLKQGSYVTSGVIPVLVSFAKENRQDLLKLAEEYIETLEVYKDLLETIHQHRHEDLLPLCQPLLKATNKGNARAKILSIASSHSRSDTQHIISLILPLLPGAGWTDHIDKVFNCLHSIPEEERIEALKLAFQLSDDFGNQWLHQCLHAVISCKTEERKEITEYALSRFQHCSLGLLFEYIHVLSAYRSSERTLLLDPFLKSISERFDNPETILQIIKLLSFYSPSERQDVLSICDPFFTMTSNDQGCILRHFLLIPPQDRQQAAEMLRLNPDQSLQNPLEYLFRWANGLKNRSLHYINQLLSHGLENKDFIQLITIRVTNLMENHLIDEEHVVAQKVIELHALYDDSPAKNNPYSVYQKLKQLSKLEKPLNPLIAPAEIEGRLVIPYVEKWRQQAQAKPFTLADLPKDLPKGNFRTLFDEFFQRIQKLSTYKLEQVIKYINDKYEYSPQLLVDLFYKPFINNLFITDGPPEKIVDTTVYGIHAILKYVCDLDHTITEGTILTEREEMLFKMCWSIRECEQGQSDGIRTFFNQLPPQYKVSNIIAKPSAEQRVADVVFETIQGVLNACFQDLKLFQLLDGEVNSAQAPHKSLYLMNRLFWHVGLRHQLKFDRHTQLIPESFFDIPLEEYMSKFFKICTPRLLVQRLQRDIAEYLEKKLIRYRDLAYTIEHMKFNVSECVILDDEGWPIAITPKGALALLLYNQALRIV